MDPTTLFIIALFLFVACAVAIGELMSRIGQAALVGQLLVGIVLGPTLLGPVLGFSSLGTEFTGLQVLATFLILLTAGLAITPEQVYETGATSAVLGVAIFVVPFLLGAGLVHLLYPGLSSFVDLFVALTVSITALPVLGIMLREFNLLQTKFGATLMSSSLVNELAAVTTFSVLLKIRNPPGATVGGVAVAFGTVAIFLGSMLLVHWLLRRLRRVRLWDRMVQRVRGTWKSREVGFALLMVSGLASALYSAALGLTFLVGAFYAGLLITPESAGPHEHRQIARVFDTITWGFFIPLFFVLVGFGMDLRTLVTSPTVLLAFLALCMFAFFSKVFVAGAVTRAIGWSSDESLGAGFLLASRGTVELAMAVILLSSGIITTSMFTVVAGVGVVTSVLSPIGARPFVRNLVTGTPPPSGTTVRPWITTGFPDRSSPSDRPPPE